MLNFARSCSRVCHIWANRATKATRARLPQIDQIEPARRFRFFFSPFNTFFVATPVAIGLGSSMSSRDYSTGVSKTANNNKNGLINSTVTQSSQFNDFCTLLSQVASKGPGFAVESSKIDIVRDPTEFYDQLMERIKTAENRIVLSSLYLGAEPMAFQMLNALDEVLAKKPDLKVTILLDCLRGTRNTASKKDECQSHMPEVGGPHEGILSSHSILYPLEKKYGDRCQVYYYHTPKLSWFLKSLLPEKYNELIGVQHIKCYLVDDDVLISGANLSQQYFTNRQDRYFWIRRTPAVAKFYQNVIGTISGFSFKTDILTGRLTFPADVPSPVHDRKAFAKYAHQALSEAFSLTDDANFEITDTKIGQEHGKNQRGLELLKAHDTWIFPTVQLGPVGLRHDEQVTELILAQKPLHDAYTSYLTSPYFNVADSYKQAILKSQKPFEMIVASPKANGFYNGGSIIGLVPWAYDTVLRQWYQELKPENDIKFFEYIRPDWTFHAKGIWMEMNSEVNETPATPLMAGSSIPLSPVSNNPLCSLTLVGSSNFGIRSMERDLESQIAVFTTNPDLAGRLRGEREYIFGGSAPVTPQTFIDRESNHSPLLTFVTPIASKFM